MDGRFYQGLHIVCTSNYCTSIHLKEEVLKCCYTKGLVNCKQNEHGHPRFPPVYGWGEETPRDHSPAAIFSPAIPFSLLHTNRWRMKRAGTWMNKSLTMTVTE